MTKLFVDMDGVLADFDFHYRECFGVKPDKKLDNVDWAKVDAWEDFYAGIPPMRDMQLLWNYIKKYEPTILTGIPSSVPQAQSNKEAWVRCHFGMDQKVICCLSKEKSLHMMPGDILIDDWDKYKPIWEAAGGRWITHTSALSTIEKLAEMGL